MIVKKTKRKNNSKEIKREKHDHKVYFQPFLKCMQVCSQDLILVGASFLCHILKIIFRADFVT